MKVSSTREIMQVPSKHLDPPWDYAISAVQSPFLRLEPANQKVNHQISLLEVHWQFCLHWVFKRKWDSRHQFPIKLPRKTKEIFQVWGDFCYQVLELCIQCHAIAPAGSLPYSNASEWFVALVWEAKNNGLKGILAPERNRGNKREKVLERRSVLARLRDSENPADPQEEPHFHRLMEVAIKLEGKSNVFRKQYWNPFLRAYSTWITDVDRNPEWQTVWRENGEYWQQAGKGGAKKKYV